MGKTNGFKNGIEWDELKGRKTMTKTNQEKSRVIAGKVGGYEEKLSHIVIISDFTGKLNSQSFKPTEWSCDCGWKGDKIMLSAHNELCALPDFFTPDGQVVLAKAITGVGNAFINCNFRDWLYSNTTRWSSWLQIIAETKLGQLFYEFLEEESGKEKTL